MKVTYNQDGREPIELHVIAENGDGTVNVAYAPKGEVLIRGVAFSDEGAPGTVSKPEVETAKTSKAKGGKASKPDADPAPADATPSTPADAPPDD